jgi:hypothetical protein
VVALEGSAAKAVVNAARLIAPAVLEQRRRRAMESRIRPLLSSADVTALLDVLVVYFGGKPDSLTELRDELRRGLALRIGSDGPVFEATELLYNFLLSAVTQVQATLQVKGKARDSAELISTMAQLTAASIRSSALMSAMANLDEVDRFVAEMRAQVRNAYGTMRLPHAGLSRTVPYSKIYVEPGIRPRGDQGGEPITVDTAVGQSLRSVVLGDPGAGKSTLAAKLAYDLASDRHGILKGKVPFLVVLRNHMQDLKRPGPVTLIDYIMAACGEPHHLFPTHEMIEHLILTNNAVLILDGVDELGDTATRRRLGRLVEGFASLYPLCPILVTSRVVGYDEAELDENRFAAYLVEEFTDDQVAEYATKWFRCGAQAYQQSPDILTATFLAESERSATDLRRNPLLLALLCGMYASTNYLPRNKPEVYEKCAEMLFERWDRSRGVDVPLRFAADIRPAIQQLAWLLLNDDESGREISRGRMLRFLSDYLMRKRYADRDVARQAAEDFLDFCAGRAWALTEVGLRGTEPVYGFAHQTFLEYFAASQLVRQGPSAPKVWESVSPHIGDSSWNEVGHLAVQILDRTVEDGANDFLRLLLRARTTSRVKIGERLRFAANVLEFCSPEPAILRRLVRKVVRQVLVGPLAGRRRLFTPFPSGYWDQDDALVTMLEAAAEDRPTILELAREEWVALATIGDWRENAAALIWWLATQPDETFTLRNLPTELFEASPPSDLDNIRRWAEFHDVRRPIDPAMGLEPYFQGTLIHGEVGVSYLNRLINKLRFDALYPRDSRATPLRLAELFELMLGTPVPWFNAEAAGEHDRVALYVGDMDFLPSLTPEARAGFFLALLPYMEFAAWSGHADLLGVFATAPLSTMQAIRERGFQPGADNRFVAGLHVPIAAREFLHRWLTGQVSVLGGLPSRRSGKIGDEDRN